MIYCVVPRPMAEELYGKLVTHYADDENVTVIVDRRHHDRRARGERVSEVASERSSTGSPIGRHRRVIRDRRRARVPGDTPPLAKAL